MNVQELKTGKYETSGRGRNKTTEFFPTNAFIAGDEVIIRMTVQDARTEQLIANASVDIEISGPEATYLNSEPSNIDGVAEAKWKNSPPRKKKMAQPPGYIQSRLRL